MNAARIRNFLIWSVLVVGLLQMTGDVLGIRVMKGIGAATAASPFPKVFCDVKGLETFASTFTLHVETESGSRETIEITPDLYAKLGGPYNRRNAYGAALSYAPRLPEPLWRAIALYGLREGGPLQQEFALPSDVRHMTMVIQTRTRGRNDIWRYELP